MLEHSINVSVQEHLKKIAVYQKHMAKTQLRKVNLLEAENSGVATPDLQYMNIYKSLSRRMACFKRITEESEQITDASTYENGIELVCKKLQQQAEVIRKAARPSSLFFEEERVSCGYMSDVSPSKLMAPLDPVSNIFFNLEARRLNTNCGSFKPSFVPKV